MNEPTDTDILKAIESGRIPVGFLYRHKTQSKDGKCQEGDWEYYVPGQPGYWLRGPDFRSCVVSLLNRSRV